MKGDRHRHITNITTESFMLELISGDHLVQHSRSKRGQLQQVVQGHVQSGFDCLQPWRLNSLSG